MYLRDMLKNNIAIYINVYVRKIHVFDDFSFQFEMFFPK